MYSIIFPNKKNWGFNSFKYTSYKHHQLLQQHQHLQHPQHQEAQAYILTFIPDWLFQMRTAASGTEAESIRLFRTSLSFRVARNIVPLSDKFQPEDMALLCGCSVFKFVLLLLIALGQTVVGPSHSYRAVFPASPGWQLPGRYSPFFSLPPPSSYRVSR